MPQTQVAENSGKKHAVAGGGLFLVKPAPQGTLPSIRPALKPALAGRSRMLSILSLAGAAAAAPILWLLHALLAALRH